MIFRSLLLALLGLWAHLGSAAPALPPVPQAIAQHNGPIRVAVIRSLATDDNTLQFVAGAVREGEKLGFRVSTYYSNGDDARFQDLVEKAIQDNYDGIILSHRNAPLASHLVKRIAAAGIRLSVFETPVDVPVAGVTLTSQDDKSLATLSLAQLSHDFQGQANIVKLWVSGYPAMERRQIVYEQWLRDHPRIHERASTGAVSADVPGDTERRMTEILAQHPKGTLDAIWGSWDAFSRGAYTALIKSGRTEIKLYSIDVSDQDLQLMRAKDSPWVQTVAVNPATIGAVNMRLIAKKLAGEPTPLTYQFKAAALSQQQLRNIPAEVPVSRLGLTVPGWGDNNDFISPWFATLEAQQAKARQ